MKIGELAAKTHTTAETIRFYEHKGLLPKPVRNASNYREYNLDHEHRLRMIRNCRSLDMSHQEILELLKVQETHSEDCSQVNQIILHHLDHVQRRIQQLKILEKALVTLTQQCTGQNGIDSCGILEGLTETLGSPEIFQNVLAHQRIHTHLG